MPPPCLLDNAAFLLPIRPLHHQRAVAAVNAPCLADGRCADDTPASIIRTAKYGSATSRAGTDKMYYCFEGLRAYRAVISTPLRIVSGFDGEMARVTPRIRAGRFLADI